MDYFTVLMTYKPLELLTLKRIFSLDPGIMAGGRVNISNSLTAAAGTRVRICSHAAGCGTVRLTVKKTKLFDR